ncbi:MAG TPA: hypothetical protein VMU51_18315, partial [Mycobacteriales bacterium]|nr:hypothetical protein [Mycobacteriales bacterium]
RQYTGVEPAGVRGRLAAAIGELGPEVTVLTGPGLAPLAADLPGDVVAGPAGQPYTGAWWALAGDRPDWTDPGRPVLLADYDPALRYLCLSTFDGAAGGAVGGATGGAAGRAAERDAGSARPVRTAR